MGSGQILLSIYFAGLGAYLSVVLSRVLKQNERVFNKIEESIHKMDEGFRKMDEGFRRMDERAEQRHQEIVKLLQLGEKRHEEVMKALEKGFGTLIQQQAT